MKPKSSPSQGLPHSRVDTSSLLKRSGPGVAQQKGPWLQHKVQHPAPRLGNRPQLTPVVLQKKADAVLQKAKPGQKAIAPPVYRPQSLPRVLQTKKSPALPPVKQSSPLPIAPRINRPQSTQTGVPSRTSPHKASAIQRHVSAAKSAALPQRPNRSSVVQRLEIVNDTVVSSFDRSMTISSSQAVLTLAATVNNWTGGHAEFFLEFMGRDNLARLWLIHLRAYADTGKVFIEQRELQVEYKPGWMASWFYSRSITGQIKKPAQYQAYLIPASAVQKVFVKATEWDRKAESGEYKYALTMGSVYSTLSYAASYVSSHKAVRYVNCTDFAHEVCQVAGIGHVASADIFSRPSSIATKDVRTKDEIYNDVAIEMV